MKKQTEILVVGTNEQILHTVLRLLNNNEEWRATGVGTEEEALSKCREQEYRVLLLGAGLSEAAEERLTLEIKRLYPSIHVIPHYGGGSGLLFAEIYLALGT